MGRYNDLAAELAEHAFGHQLIDQIVLYQKDARAMRNRAGFQLDKVEDDFAVGAQGTVQYLIQRGATQ